MSSWVMRAGGRWRGSPALLRELSPTSPPRGRGLAKSCFVPRCTLPLRHFLSSSSSQWRVKGLGGVGTQRDCCPRNILREPKGDARGRDCLMWCVWGGCGEQEKGWQQCVFSPGVSAGVETARDLATGEGMFPGSSVRGGGRGGGGEAGRPRLQDQKQDLRECREVCKGIPPTVSPAEKRS